MVYASQAVRYSIVYAKVWQLYQTLLNHSIYTGLVVLNKSDPV